ncbi:MAG: Adenine deaminase, partial [Solirubrobacterales bacterium]|nr:Adenine deaminase [Solirubrobacterales bacterium]
MAGCNLVGARPSDPAVQTAPMPHEDPAVPALARRLAVARGEAPADRLLRGGRVLDVHTGTVRRADVAIADGLVVGVGDYVSGDAVEDVGDVVLAPALIEGHMHLESTLLAPAEAARLLAACGTGTVVADPHEVANVLGPAGIAWMRAELRGAPLDVRLQAPSCVPATEQATTGGRI